MHPVEGVPDASETLMHTLATGFSRAAGWFFLRLLKEKLEANIPKLAVLLLSRQAGISSCSAVGRRVSG